MSRLRKIKKEIAQCEKRIELAHSFYSSQKKQAIFHFGKIASSLAIVGGGFFLGFFSVYSRTLLVVFNRQIFSMLRNFEKLSVGYYFVKKVWDSYQQISRQRAIEHTDKAITH